MAGRGHCFSPPEILAHPGRGGGRGGDQFKIFTGSYQALCLNFPWIKLWTKNGTHTLDPAHYNSLMIWALIHIPSEMINSLDPQETLKHMLSLYRMKQSTPIPSYTTSLCLLGISLISIFYSKFYFFIRLHCFSYGRFITYLAICSGKFSIFLKAHFVTFLALYLLCYLCYIIILTSCKTEIPPTGTAPTWGPPTRSTSHTGFPIQGHDMSFHLMSPDQVLDFACCFYKLSGVWGGQFSVYC